MNEEPFAPPRFFTIRMRRTPEASSPFRGWWPRRTTAPQRQALVRLIAVAAEERLPLAPLLEAWAEDERGVQSGRVRRLARLLRDGVPLADAVEQVPGALRDEDALAIRFGAQSGTLPAVLRQTLADMEATAAGRAPLFRQTLVYLCGYMAVLTVVVTFLQITIVPKYMQIYDDFELEPPVALRWSTRLGDVFVNYWFLFALGLLAVAWLAFSVRGGRFVRRAIMGRFFRPFRELRSAELLQKLGVALEAGRPIAGALSTLARYHFDPALRHKLLFVRNEVEQGADVWTSMTAAGLLAAPEGKLMATADRVGNRPWVLQKVAAGKRRRTMRRLHRLAELFLPAAVLLLGAFVLLQALAMFAPLVNLLSAMTS
jgi:type II secretory pathway component PulF